VKVAQPDDGHQRREALLGSESALVAHDMREPCQWCHCTEGKIGPKAVPGHRVVCRVWALPVQRAANRDWPTPPVDAQPPRDQPEPAQAHSGAGQQHVPEV
jgi:hypothetical protein